MCDFQTHCTVWLFAVGQGPLSAQMMLKMGWVLRTSSPGSMFGVTNEKRCPNKQNENMKARGTGDGYEERNVD